MFVIDAKLAKQAYEERLRWAEQERYSQQVMTNQSGLQVVLRQKLGDLFIAFGMRLKAQPQQKFF